MATLITYTADFETTTDPEDCRVWAWGLCSVDDQVKFEWGTDIGDLIKRLEKRSCTVYFHNLKFDGEFLVYWLYRNGYEHRDSNDMCTKSFSTLISDKGVWYQVKICVKMRYRNPIYITINDSMKLFPMSVDKVAKSFHLEEQKGELDYNKPRPLGYVPDEAELGYLKNDVTIMARALKMQQDQGLTKMTVGSNALQDFKNIFTEKMFDYHFPQPAYDQDVRRSYRGGFTYLDPRYTGKKLGRGITLDVNSLYPSIMYDRPLPVGEGIFFEGEYEPDHLYPLYVQMMTFQFEIKPGHIPTIQIKNKDAGAPFSPTEYLTSSGPWEVTMAVTSVDLQLMQDHYELYNITYHSGWKFKASSGMFCAYIDKWTRNKVEAKESGNGGLYTLSKLMLNSLYGKFALNPVAKSKQPVYREGEDWVQLIHGEPEAINPIYIPVGTFITAWARDKTIRAAQAVYDRFIYSDTDSLSLLGTELPAGLEIHDTKLGAWSIDNEFESAKFLRAKTYVKFIDGKLHITCAGMPKACYDGVTFENFEIGSSYPGKLMPKRVRGGVVLEETVFTLNNKSFIL